MASTPCEQAPEDWYIEKDGRQYADVPLISEELARERTVPPISVERTREVLEGLATKDALARRRRARDACHRECPVRLECLTKALDGRELHGIWGGYFPEQLKVIYREQDRRAVGGRA